MTMAGLLPWGVVWACKLGIGRPGIGLSVGFFQKWGQWCELRGRTRSLGPTAASARYLGRAAQLWNLWTSFCWETWVAEANYNREGFLV